MSHSMQTTNFDLPLFADNDSPTWLGDFNEAMGTMDTAMAKVSNDSNSQVNAIANLTTRVEGAEEKVAAIDKKVKGYDAAIAGKAPTMHADATVTYGAASGTLYGHVRLEDVPGNYGAGDGRAATPKALQTVDARVDGAVQTANAAKSSAETANTAAQNAQKAANDASSAASDAASKANAADRKAQQALDAVGMGGGTGGSGEYAPVPHADTTTKYGSASSTKYGHVKLVDTITTSTASSGTAPSPNAVKAYVDNAISQGGGTAGEVRVYEKQTTYGKVKATYRDGLVIVRVNANYYSSDNVTAGSTYEMDTLPSNIRPHSQYAANADVEIPSVGHGAAGILVNANGKVEIVYSGPTTISTLAFNAEVVYFAGV